MLWVNNVAWRLRAFVYCTTGHLLVHQGRRCDDTQKKNMPHSAVQQCRAEHSAEHTSTTEQKSRAEQSAQQKSRAEDTAAQRADGRVQRRQRRGQAAHHADCRNPSPVIAMKMYAFRVRYLTTFSKHQSAQAQARKATLSSLLRSCSSFV